MTKERCPFLGKLRDGNLSGCECVQEQCMFYRAKESRCVFIEIGTASREYLESLKRMAEQNELSLMRERATDFSESEKAERVQLYASQASINKNQGNFSKALLDYKKALILAPNDSAVHRALADIYSIQGISDEAISSYRQALKQHPDDDETWIRLILQYRAINASMPDCEKRYAETIEKLRNELKEVKNESTVNTVLGNAVLILHSQDAEKFEEQRKEAQSKMEKALELNPANIWAHLGLKDIMLYNNNYEGAIKQLLEGLKHNPDNSRLSFELGECYLLAHAEHHLMNEDCLSKASDSYTKLLQQDPGYAPAYFRLGHICEQKASYDQAIEYYKQGLTINPINQFAHFRLGKIHLLMGMTELAISRFKEVIELSKNRVHEIYQEGYRFNKLRFFKEASALEAWIEMGKILVRRRQYDEAADAFQKALSIDKSSPLAISNQIDLYKIRTADSKDTDTLYSKYIEQFKNAAMVDFQNPVAHYALAYACQVLPAVLADKQEERTEEALNSFQMAINLKPDFKWAYWGLKNSYLTVYEDSQPLYEQALEACKLVTELDSEDPRAYFETGDVYHRMGDVEQALTCFEKALEKDKTYIPAYLNMATIKHDAGNFDETIKLYQKIIRINPNFAQGYYELGRVYQEIHENEKALSNLRKAIELDIDYTEAHFAIGQICYEEGQDETAKIRMSRVIELIPENAEAHYYLGMIHHRGGRFKMAVEELETAIKLSSDSTKYEFDLAKLYVSANQWNEASSVLERILEKSPEHIEAMLCYANVLENLSQQNDAEREYLKVIDIDQKNLEAHENLARLYESTDQIYKAEDEFLKVVELQPQHVDALMSLAKIYLIRDLRDKALEALGSVITIKPDIFEAHLELGRIYCSRSMLDESAESYLKAIAIRPGAPQAHVELAEVYISMDNNEKAIEEFEKALEIDPSLTEALSSLGDLYSFRENYEQASKCYHQATTQPDSSLLKAIIILNSLKKLSMNILRLLKSTMNAQMLLLDLVRFMLPLKSGKNQPSSTVRYLKPTQATQS